MWVTPHHRPPRPPPPYMCVVANQAFCPPRSFRRLDTGRSAPSTSSASSSHQSRSVRTVGPCVPSARFPAGDCDSPTATHNLPRETLRSRGSRLEQAVSLRRVAARARCDEVRRVVRPAGLFWYDVINGRGFVRAVRTLVAITLQHGAAERSPRRPVPALRRRLAIRSVRSGRRAEIAARA